MNSKEKSPILEAFGITAKEADEIEVVTKELIAKYNKRSEVIKELKRRYRGNKLLYAIGFAEFTAGYFRGLEDGAVDALSKIIIIEGNQ